MRLDGSGVLVGAVGRVNVKARDWFVTVNKPFKYDKVVVPWPVLHELKLSALLRTQS